MSVVRFSAIGSQMFAPKGAGEFIDQPFRKQRMYGRLGDLARPADEEVFPVLARHSALVDRYLQPSLERAAAALPADQPVCVMVHGFLFDPQKARRQRREDNDNPHYRLYHFDWARRDDGSVDEAQLEREIKHHTTGWLKSMGFAPDDGGAAGLAVALGWYSSPGFASSLLEGGRNFYTRAYDYGRSTAWPFLVMLNSLARTLDDRSIDIYCHSLGSTVVIRALAIAAKHDLGLVERIGRVIILGGSEYTGEANILYRRMLARIQAAGMTGDDGPQFYNIVSRENFVLDVMAENFGPKSFFTDTQVVGHNGLESRPEVARWIDLQIDGSAMRDWVETHHGFRISGDNPETVWDHWYYYTWPGNTDLYRSILRNRDAWSLASLRAEPKVPEGVAVGFFGD